MPAWAARAYTALGSRPGLALLAVLASRSEPVGNGELSAATGLNAQTTSRTLQHLEDSGLIVSTVPPPRHRGTRVDWSLNRDALAAILRDLDAGLGTDIATHPTDQP